MQDVHRKAARELQAQAMRDQPPTIAVPICMHVRTSAGCAPRGCARAASASDARPRGEERWGQGQAGTPWPSRTPAVRQPPRVQGRLAT
eukprot:scaffold119795_cov24-Tisochrysis_lutea.AAC.1